MAEAILAMRDRAAAAGIASGILARDSSEAVMRREQGFQMIGLGADINLMMASIQHRRSMLRESTTRSGARTDV